MNRMNDADYARLIEIRAKGELTYGVEEMRRNAYGKPFNDRSPDSIKADVHTINEIMGRYCDTFTSFKSFTQDGRIRYNHHWNKKFIGVAYTYIELLRFGFPLGNYDKQAVYEFRAEHDPHLVAFVNIDDWNRPVFKSLRNKSEYYGCLDKTFPYGESESSVLDHVDVSDLRYFGSKFNCEPMGTELGDHPFKITSNE